HGRCRGARATEDRGPPGRGPARLQAQGCRSIRRRRQQASLRRSHSLVRNQNQTTVRCLGRRVKYWPPASVLVNLSHEMAGPRATPPLLKDLTGRTILEAIRAGAPISRAEISRRAGISKPTVSLALESLLTAGLLREADHDPDGPSYGAIFFEP